MNKKIVITILIICLILIICFLSNNKKDKDIQKISSKTSSTTENQITEEEYKEISNKYIKQKLEKSGLNLTNEKPATSLPITKGYSYNIRNENETIEDKPDLEIYTLTFQEKLSLFREISTDYGYVKFEVFGQTMEGILYGNNLITNISNSNLKTQIYNTLIN